MGAGVRDIIPAEPEDLIKGVPTETEAQALTEPVFGTSRPIEELTLDDILRHPIWVWALDEETVEGQDETWVKPVTNTEDAGEDLAYFFPLLTFRVVGSQLHGFGDYDHDGFTTGDGVPLIFGFRIWQAGGWRELPEVEGLSAPVVFEAVPRILGREGARFQCDTLDAWQARRID